MSTHAPTQQTPATRSRRGWRATRQLLAVPLAAFALLVVAAPAQAYVYWANTGSGTIGRANLAGTNVDQSFVTGASEPEGVAPTQAYVYWTNRGSGTIGRASLDGTSVDQSFITGASSPEGVAVDGAHIYWTNEGTGTIGRASLDGTNVDQSFVTGTSTSGGIAVDGAHIYWNNNNNGTIGRASLNGANVDQSFVTGASEPEGVAVDGAHIYWANFDTGTIGRANLDGTGVNDDLITGASYPDGVAVDSAHIYWTNAGNDTIGRANLDGTGANHSFITGASTAVGVAVDGLTSVPPPVLGKSVDAAPVSGVVLLKQPGKRGFVRLRAGERIPVGSTLDTTAGVVSLTAAKDRKGHTTTGRFYAGVFRLTQVPSQGVEITVLTLAGPKPSGCSAASSATVARRRPRKRKRSLWGNSKGDFRTKGAYASATERGTRWLTQDTCAGTLIHVAQGEVTVDDLPHHRTFLLKAPHSFLAHRGKGG